eukprot:4558188-Amphidinium_carterae.1
MASAQWIFQKGRSNNWTIPRERIVFIGKPGKLRSLTAGSPFLYWASAPWAKLLQSLTAYDPDHRVGLVGAQDAFMHLTRLLPSGETDFIWKDDGTLKEDVHHLFAD